MSIGRSASSSPAVSTSLSLWVLVVVMATSNGLRAASSSTSVTANPSPLRHSHAFPTAFMRNTHRKVSLSLWLTRPYRPRGESDVREQAFRSASRVHADRTAGGDRDHRDSHRHVTAGGAEGARGSGPQHLPEQPETDGPGRSQLRERERQTPRRRRRHARNRSRLRQPAKLQRCAAYPRNRPAVRILLPFALV